VRCKGYKFVEDEGCGKCGVWSVKECGVRRSVKEKRSERGPNPGSQEDDDDDFHAKRACHQWAALYVRLVRLWFHCTGCIIVAGDYFDPELFWSKKDPSLESGGVLKVGQKGR